MTAKEFVEIHNRLRKQYPGAAAYHDPEHQTILFFSLQNLPAEAVAAAVDDWATKYPRIAPSISFIKRLAEIYANGQTPLVVIDMRRKREQARAKKRKEKEQDQES